MDGRAILDSSVLINLEATGSPHAIARAINMTFAVAVQVARETFLLDVHTAWGFERVARDVDAWGDALEVTELLDHELADFVSLTTGLGDGEAASIAVATSRSDAICVDDLRAIREAHRRGLTVVRTADLMVRWERSGASPTDVSRALLRIQQRARFHPRATDPYYDWWMNRCG